MTYKAKRNIAKNTPFLGKMNKKWAKSYHRKYACIFNCRHKIDLESKALYYSGTPFERPH